MIELFAIILLFTLALVIGLRLVTNPTRSLAILYRTINTLYFKFNPIDFAQITIQGRHAPLFLSTCLRPRPKHWHKAFSELPILELQKYRRKRNSPTPLAVRLTSFAAIIGLLFSHLSPIVHPASAFNRNRTPQRFAFSTPPLAGDAAAQPGYPIKKVRPSWLNSTSPISVAINIPFGQSDFGSTSAPEIASSNSSVSSSQATLSEVAGEVEALFVYTDDTGHYRFQNIPKATHKIWLDLATLPERLSPAEGEDSPALWLNPGMTVTSEPLSTGVRFTAVYERERGDISGFVFEDLNRNGQPDPGEPGLAGVRVIDPALHQYFVPFNDVNLWELFDDKNTGLTPACHPTGVPVDPAAGLESFIFLTASSDGTVFYYDHWEDGYDPDPVVPGPTTQVGILDAGASELFENVILPANIGSTFYFDGRDRITVFGEKATVIRQAFPVVPGPVLAGAWEVSEVADWGTDFVATVGEDLNFNPGINDHQFSGLEVMAAAPGTQIFRNGSLVGVLDPGETLFINGANDGPGGGGVDSDDVFTSTAPIQIQMLNGACDARYSADGYMLLPVNDWSNAYWAPVPGFTAACNRDGLNVDTDIYLHNPNNNPIVVTVDSNLGSNRPVTVPANTTLSLLDYVTSNPPTWVDVSTGTSGIFLRSNFDFWGVGVIDSTSNGAGSAANYDWGYSLIPQNQLSSQSIIGFAPGNNLNPPTDNGNSAFVTAITDTTIFVDLSQDGLPDPVDMNGDGDALDHNVFGVAEWDEPLSAQGIPLRAGQTVRVGDPVDRNLLGALIYTTELNERIAVAWGQDACRAFLSNPYIDMGYTALPYPVPSLTKSSQLAVDADMSGDNTPGDTIAYTLVLVNNGQGPMNNIEIVDALPFTHTSYIVGSLQASTPPSAAEFSNDGVNFNAPENPDIQAFRVRWPVLAPRGIITLTLLVMIDLDLPTGVTQVVNNAIVDSDETDPVPSQDPSGSTLDPRTITPIGRPLLSIAKRASPVTVGPAQPFTYTIVVSNTGNSAARDVEISDILASATQYIPGTFRFTYPIAQVISDSFDTIRVSIFNGFYVDDFDNDTNTDSSGYGGSDGFLTWSGPWSELGDDGNPTIGRVTVQNNPANAVSSPGYLQLTGGGAGSGDVGVVRQADLSNFISPTIRFNIRGSGIDQSDDAFMVVLNGVTPVTSTTYNGIYTIREIDLSAVSGAAGNPNATVSFIATAGLEAGDSYFFDNIAIYDGSPERTSVETIISQQATLSYTVSSSIDPASYDPVTQLMVITQGLLLPAGGVVTATFQVTTTIPLTNGLSLVNTAAVTASNWLEITSPPTDTATVQIVSNHTLSISKTDDPDPVAPGSLLVYTLAYTVSGNDPAPNVVITDAIPAGTTFVSATGGLTLDTPPVGGSGVVTWFLGDLLPVGSGILQETGVVSFIVRIDPIVTSGSINNIAFIRDDSGASDQDDETTQLNVGPILAINKVSSTGGLVAPGGRITYTIVAANNGNSPATNAVISDPLPGNVTFVPGTISLDPPGSGLPGSQPPSLASGLTIDPGERVTVTFVAMVDPVATDGTQIVNTAMITSSEIPTPTQSTVTDTVISTPLLHLAKFSSPTGVTLAPGDLITYTLVYSNNGVAPATGVVLTDFIPLNTTYLTNSVVVDSGTVEFYDGTTWGSTDLGAATQGLRWNIGILPPDGVNRAVSFTVRINTTIVDPVSGMVIQYLPEGWRVLEGDITGMTQIDLAPTPTPIPTITPTLVATPTVMPVVTPTITSTPAISPTPALTLTVTPTPVVITTPVVTTTPTPTPTASVTPTQTITETAPPEPVATPTLTPTVAVEPGPAEAASPEPTSTVTATETTEAEPTPAETPVPETAPTEAPTTEPTGEPAESNEAGAGEPGAYLNLPPLLISVSGLASLRLPEVLLAAAPAYQTQITWTTSFTPDIASEVTLTATMVMSTSPAIEPTVEAGSAPTPEVEAPAAMEVPAPAEVSAAAAAPIVTLDSVEVTIANMATIDSNETPTQTAQTNNPVLRIVDPIITKRGDPSQALPGDAVRYFIDIENPSPPSNANANNLVVMDALPPQLTLVDYAVSSEPPGIPIIVSDSTKLIPIIGHPSGVNQAPASTIVLTIPVLAPGQSVALEVNARVNELASPGPQTIINLAQLFFNEGAARSDNTALNIPAPPPLPSPPPSPRSDKDDDDDDDDATSQGAPPAVQPASPQSVSPPAQPTPTLPVLFLPETGVRATRSEGVPLNDIGAWVFILASLSGVIFWRWRKFRKSVMKK